MIDDNRVESVRITDEYGRAQALEVLCATYRNEKGWVSDPGLQFPAEDLSRHDVAWYMVSLNGAPVGVLRTLFDPPLIQYARYGLRLIDPRIDVEAFLRKHRIAEVGRFAVVPDHRA
ncbi:MAG: hypothetical protein J2P50_16625, partial [Hyphomicrobiaceae bacterium]|nr:hypothetical protein [Hyphomicrobiaceae bacterium]